MTSHMRATLIKRNTFLSQYLGKQRKVKFKGQTKISDQFLLAEKSNLLKTTAVAQDDENLILYFNIIKQEIVSIGECNTILSACTLYGHCAPRIVLH